MSKPLAALVCLLLAAVPVLAGPMTIGERQRLVAHLEMTEAWVDSDLHALATAHPANQGSKSAQGLSEEVDATTKDTKSQRILFNEKGPGLLPAPP